MSETEHVVKTSGLAISSLVLGMLSLLCFGMFSGIPAVICGHLAQSTIRKSEGTIGGGGLAIGGLVTGYIGTVFTTITVLGILAGMMLPAVSAARDRARRTQCMSNMKQIGLVCNMYALDHDSKYPSRFSELKDVGGSSVLLFKCPATDTVIGSFASIDQWSDYLLVPNKSSNDSAGDVLAFSKPECYSRGGNILMVDGSVRWCSIVEYNQLTAEFRE